MTSPDVPVGAQPAGNAGRRPARFRVSLPPLPGFSLGNWTVSRRLITLIVLAVVMGLVFGGLRIASAAGSATGFGRTTQLAVLGEQAAALAQAMANERDLTAGLCAASPGGNCPNPGEKLDQTARSLQAEVQRAQAATNAAAGRVRALAAQIGGSFPANTQIKAAEVVAMIGHIGSQETPGVRTLVASQPAAAVIDTYSQAIGDLFNLNDEITSGSGDAVLADEVRTLGALSMAKDEVSQERAIFYAALVQGSLGDAPRVADHRAGARGSRPELLPDIGHAARGEHLRQRVQRPEDRHHTAAEQLSYRDRHAAHPRPGVRPGTEQRAPPGPGRRRGQGTGRVVFDDDRHDHPDANRRTAGGRGDRRPEPGARAGRAAVRRSSPPR